MKIIKVDAIDSTNTFLKGALRDSEISSPTCVWAKKQTDGRGQRGAKWESKPGVNLTFSVFYPVPISIQNRPFVINMLTTISLYEALINYNLINLKIKWPNDILSANKKIGGILIENSYQSGVLSGTVIGIGLNVNQSSFENLPKASSIKNILGKSISLDVLFEEIISKLTQKIKNFSEVDFNEVKRQFESLLFRNKKPSTFTVGGLDFTGIIQGVTDNGLLCLLEEDGVSNEYDLKQIEMKY